MTARRAPLALVTGGHRRLGARIAMRLARAGYSLAIHGRHDAEPHPFLAECLLETGAEWHGFVADFLEPGAAETLIPAVVQHFGRAPDLLVNSAAIFGQDRLENVTEDDLSRHFSVNASVPVRLSRDFAKAAREEGVWASIVNILDQRLAHPHGDQLSYTLAKFALEGFTRLAAREMAPSVRVNAVAPGLTLATEDYSDEQLIRLTAIMPLQRLPAAEEVADAVLFLAQASSITGQTICVDGGAHMQSYTRDFMHLGD
jgi:NAD(P)-dependent dehydrogenase (short-subunit alcohol dehydrogenase family)